VKSEARSQESEAESWFPNSCHRTAADALASAGGIYPQGQLSTQLDEGKTDQGKKERFFAKKWRNIPMERKN
jgi:hypothetical protein